MRVTGGFVILIDNGSGLSVVVTRGGSTLLVRKIGMIPDPLEVEEIVMS